MTTALVDRAVLAGSGETIGISLAASPGVPADVTSLSLGDVRLLYVAAAGGSFTLTLAGSAAVTVPYGCLPSNTDGTSGVGTLRAILEAVPAVGVGGVAVTGINPYRIQFTQPQAALTYGGAGLLASRPADPTTAGVSAESTNVDFSNRRGQWVKVAGGWVTGERYDSPGGAAGAEVRFTSPPLTPGNYRVLAGWPGGAGFATDAPYRFYDGSTYLGIIRVNQSVPTESDKAVGGTYAAEALGTFYCSSGSLTVVVGDDADGKVAADALCVQPADPNAVTNFTPDVQTWKPYRVPEGGSHWSYVSSLGPLVWNGFTAYTNTYNEIWNLPLRGLRSGAYRVEFNWYSPGAAQASAAAPVSVSADKAAPASMTVDQTAATPADATHSDGVNAVPFKNIGTYTIKSGLVVTLAEPASAPTTVLFSCVRVSPVSFSPTTVPAVVASVPPVAPWSYRVDGGAAVPITKAVWASDARDRPYVALPLAAAIPAGAAVTVSAPGGAIGTTAGVSPALTDFAVTNYAGATSVTPVNMYAPRPMRMAWNLMAPGGANPLTGYCDITKSMGGFYSPYGAPLTLDAAGYVTSGTGRSIICGSAADALDPGGYRNAPEGTYTAFWSGTAPPVLEEASEGTAVAGPVTTIANGDNMRTFAVTKNPAYNGLSLAVNVTGGSCLNLRIYLPGTAINTADGTAPVFRDEFLAKLAGAKALRAMQWYTPMYSCWSQFSDYPAAGVQAYGDFNRDPTVPVASVAPYPNTEHYGSYIYMPCLVNCPAPHGLSDGSVVTMSCPDTPGAPRSDGGFIAIDTVSFGVYYDPLHMTTSQFVIFLNVVANRPTAGTYAGSAVSMASAVTPAAGTAKVSRACGAPPSVFFGLCNRNGSDAWFNLSTVAPGAGMDELVRQLATLAANTLIGKLILEWSNEAWNTGFPPFHWVANYAASRGLNAFTAYAMISDHFLAVARAAFVAAGRDPNDVVCYFNVQLGNPANAYSVIDYLKANGKACDAIGGAPYWRIGPAYQTGIDYDALTPGQSVDLAELQTSLMPDPHKPLIALVRSHLDANGYASTKLWSYEGGPEDCILGGTPLNQARHTRDWHLSPRILAMLLYKYKMWQDAGLTMVCQYTVGFPYTPENTPPATKSYTAYTAWDMVAAAGDGLYGLPDNRVNRYLLTGKASVVGHAFQLWNATPGVAGVRVFRNQSGLYRVMRVGP